MPAEPLITPRASDLEEDPLLGFNFMLELGDQVAGYFTEVSGVGSENEIIEHKVVDSKGMEAVRKIPGRLKWTDITLKRGITSNLQIWEWREMVIQGKITDARTNVTLTMMNREYQAVAKWHFTNAWPSKASGPSFKADDNSFGIEEVTIVHEGMYRES
jgi:phage tail-like protein